MGTALLLAAGLSRWPAWVGLIAAGTLLWGLSGLGHGAHHGPSVRLLHAVHAGAMAVWLGGILTLTSWPESRSPALERLGSVATLCVLILGITGVVASWEHVGGVPDLTTPYGRILVLKLVFVGVVLIVAGLVRSALRAPVQTYALLLLELGSLVLIVVVPASLAVTPTPAHGLSAVPMWT